MSEIEELKKLFAAKPRPTSWAELPARMDEICAIDPPAGDIAFTPFEISGVKAEWSLAPGSDESRVLLYFHGGGYCSGSIASHRGMVSETGRAAGVRTLAIAYRLAPEHPYPAALEDALAAWRFLRAEGYAPERIVIGGDSAGGNLTLSLLIALREAGEALPAGAWLVSPWTDLTQSGASLDAKASVDPLISRDYLNGLAAAFLDGREGADPAVSPLFAALEGLPPTLIQVGSSEGLLDDSVRLAGRLGAAEVKVTLEVWPQMIHAWAVWLQRLTEGRAATAQAGAWIAGQLGAARTG